MTRVKALHSTYLVHSPLPPRYPGGCAPGVPVLQDTSLAADPHGEPWPHHEPWATVQTVRRPARPHTSTGITMGAETCAGFKAHVSSQHFCLWNSPIPLFCSYPPKAETVSRKALVHCLYCFFTAGPCIPVHRKDLHRQVLLDCHASAAQEAFEKDTSFLPVTAAEWFWLSLGYAAVVLCSFSYQGKKKILNIPEVFILGLSFLFSRSPFKLLYTSASYHYSSSGSSSEFTPPS